MIGFKKGEDINDAIKGPVGYLGAGIVIIALVVALANDWDSNIVPPDEPILFGGFLADMIYEIKYYMFAVVPLVMITGGIMIALQLKIHPNYKARITLLSRGKPMIAMLSKIHPNRASNTNQLTGY